MTTDEVVAFFGGTKVAVAEALKCTPPAVTKWGEEPPRSRQWQLQVISKGKLRVSVPDPL